MKKTLVALAALAATSAFAQSSVTMYGVLDVGYGTKQFQDNAGTVMSKQSGIMDGGYAGNRIGFRGTEDLGAGQALGFVIEQGISPTNGALFGVRTGNAGIQLDGYAPNTGKFDPGTGGGYQQDTNRQTFASLSDKSLGEVRVGYQYTALYEVSTLMGFTSMSEGVVGGSNTHVYGQGFAGGTRANGIQYISPRFNGFGLAVQTGSTKNRDTTEFSSAANNSASGTSQEKNKRTSLKLDFEQGPWKAAFAQTSMVNGTGGKANNGKLNSTTVNTLLTYNVYGALTGAAANTPAYTAYSTKLNQAALKYTGSNWFVGYQMNNGTASVTAEDGNANTSASYNAASKIGDYKIKSSRISGQYSIGQFDLIAGTGTGTVDSQANTTRIEDFKETQIGAIYNLSKTSKLYAYNGSWKNSAAQYNTTSKNYEAKQTIIGLFKSF